MFKLKDVAITTVIVILAVILALFLIGESNKSKELQNLSKEIEIKTSEYRIEKKKLTDELNNLLNQKITTSNSILGVVPVITYSNETFKYENLPILNEFDIQGVLCITQSELPTVGNVFTEDEIQALSDKGWEFAYYWDGHEPIDEWYLEITRLMSEVGFSLPEILYIDYEYYSEIDFNDLTLMGIKCLIVNSDPSQTIVADENSDIVVIPSYNYLLEDLPISESSNTIGLTFFYNSEFNQSFSDQISQILNNFKTKFQDYEVHIGTYSKISEKRYLAQSINENLVAEHEQKIANIQEQIEKINKNIESIRLEHHNK